MAPKKALNTPKASSKRAAKKTTCSSGVKKTTSIPHVTKSIPKNAKTVNGAEKTQNTMMVKSKDKSASNNAQRVAEAVKQAKREPKQAAKKLPPTTKKEATKKPEKVTQAQKRKAHAVIGHAIRETELQLMRLLKSSAPADEVVSFITSPACGLEFNCGVSHTGWTFTTGATPFLIAARENRLDVLQLLFTEHSPNTQFVDLDHCTALHFAARNKNFEMVKFLVEVAGCDALAINTISRAPFDYAVFIEDNRIAEYLLSKGIPPLALHSAARVGLVETAKYLIGRGCNINAVIEVCCYSRSSRMVPLHEAIHGKQLEMVSLLLEQGADPDLVGDEGGTSLHLASQSGQTEIGKMLVEKGANLNLADDRKNTPLHYAISRGNSVELAERFLSLGADYSFLNTDNRTAFQLACQKGWIDGMKWMVAHGGVSLDTTDVFGFTALCLSIARESSSATLLLLELGADPNVLTNHKQNALHLACFQGNVELAERLIAAGVNINELDEDRCTPLDIANRRQHSILAHYDRLKGMLLANGAIRNNCSLVYL